MAKRTIEEVERFLTDEIALRQRELDTVKGERGDYMLNTNRASRDRIAEEERDHAILALKSEIGLLQVVQQFASGELQIKR